MEEITIIQTETSILATYNENTRISIHRMFPGIFLGFNQINTKALPVDKFAGLFDHKIICTINFGIMGICEIWSDKGNYLYMKGGNMSVSSESASVQFDYPTGFYSGAEIYITDDVFEKSGDLLDYWSIDLKTITDRWQDKQTTFIGNTPEIYDEHIKKLMKMNENGSVDLVQLRLICLMILNLMSRSIPVPEPLHISALTPFQVNAAKTAEEIMTKDLSARYTIPEIADKLNVGESSLKNWFRSVYGKSVSEYMRDMRLKKAKDLLSDTNLHISEIAASVGFENQSKFTSMFCKYCECTPTEYRRKSNNA